MGIVGAGMLFVLVMITVVGTQDGAQDRQADEGRRQRFTPAGIVVDPEGPAGGGPRATEAPAGFDDLTNGYLEQGPPFEELDEDSVVALRSFNDNRFIFEEREGIEDGLGPTYNAQGCVECHQNVVTGGASQIAEHRTGRSVNGEFFESMNT